jgi:hypothetical protein
MRAAPAPLSKRLGDFGHDPARVTMGSTDFAAMETMSTEQLYQFVTENDSSQRKWKALHILEQRRMEPLVKAAKDSARAAMWAAVAAAVSALVALVGIAL